MFRNIFKNEEEESDQREANLAEVSDPEGGMWAVFQIIKNKDKREFNKFIKGTESLYNAWVNYQPKLSQDEVIEQELVATENTLEELQGEAE